VVVSEIREGIPDLVKAFNSERRDELAGFEGFDGCGTIWWWGEASWVSGLETSKDVDLRVSECNG
jgi:hypothetical protein